MQKQTNYCNHLDCSDEKCCDEYYLKRTGKMTMDGTYVWVNILGAERFSKQPKEDQLWAIGILPTNLFDNNEWSNKN